MYSGNNHLGKILLAYSCNVYMFLSPSNWATSHTTLNQSTFKKVLHCIGQFRVHQYFVLLITILNRIYIGSLNNANSLSANINPNQCGLFGLPDMRGGLILPELRKRGLAPPNFILEQQTESHMKAEVFS